MTPVVAVVVVIVVVVVVVAAANMAPALRQRVNNRGLL